MIHYFVTLLISVIIMEVIKFIIFKHDIKYITQTIKIREKQIKRLERLNKQFENKEE